MKKSIGLIAIISLLLSTPCMVSCDTTTKEADAQTKAIYGKVETPQNFDDQIKSGYVILDFYADWCPPCKKLLPIFTEVATQYPVMRFIKVNFDKHKNLIKKYGVRSIPTLIVLKDGKEVKRNVGAMSKTELTKWIKELP